MMLASPHQVREIKALQRRIGLDDAAYRDALRVGFGVGSCKELTAEQAEAFKARLNGASTPPHRTPRVTATGRYAKLLQALWIAGHNLGVVTSPDDAALIAWVQRQARVDHTRFLTDPADARKAVEGLKRWLTREAGVVWPRRSGKPADHEADVLANKRAIIAAQLRRLAALDGDQPADVMDLSAMDGRGLDFLSAALGRQLRAVLTLTGGSDRG